VAADPALHARLEDLARAATMLFVAGLPGTGKSLVIHQLSHLAARAGRPVHLLQWDVARPVFESSAAGRRYPMVDGVTHAVVRKAVGLWARRAVVQWTRGRSARALLLGETPLVGNRLLELARPADDDAEAVLRDAGCRFVIPVPSVEVRRVVESERERRAARPRHEREREDAPPAVLRALWRELRAVAPRLGLAAGAGDAGTYDPETYRRVYAALLRHRHAAALPLATVLPTGAFSVYDDVAGRAELTPTDAEADAAVREVERRYPDPAALDAEVARWWEV
jgi:hypothetical protein